MRKALVIGSETGGLAGVHNDVATMTALLTQRGFDVDSRTGANATREGILDGYERLIAGVVHGDAAVVYYSGHGGLARILPGDGDPRPDIQFIVPTDYDDSRPGDFRGITDIELSVLLTRLTGRTRNATVILDCCHAAHMSRQVDLRVRALPHPTYLDVSEHNAMLRSVGLPVDVPDTVSNPYAVRLVACAPWESAYEYTNSQRLQAGVATDSLRVALEELGTARVDWTALIQRIRSRVEELAPGQRPEVEGPSRRLLFDVEQARTGRTFTVVHLLPDRVSLPGAAMLGVRPGDQFGITLPGTPQANEETMVARATVSHTDGASVEAAVQLCDGHAALPAVVEAHPLVTSSARGKVCVRGDGPLVARVRAAVAAEPTLRVVGPDDPPDNDPLLAAVAVGDELALWDGGTQPLVSVPADDAGVTRIVADLCRLARTAGLRRLVPGPDEELAEPFTVEWGRVVDGVPQRLPASGALLHAGDRVYLKLRNDGDRDLYFFVFNLGVSGAVRLITAADQSGLRLQRGQEYVVGQRDGGPLKGTELYWPAGVPTADARPETLLVIVTNDREDLSVFAHEGADLTVRSISSLRDAMAAAMRFGTRDWSTVDGKAVRYAVVRLEGQLSAVPAPAREAARFLVDERPEPSMRLLQPRTRYAAPHNVAVRLCELVVHRNRALLGADVRVDALVLSGGGEDLPVYRAATARFNNVRDGDRLPLDNLLVYHGPAVDYLDIAWWVSRDRRESLELNDLLRERLNSDDVRRAVASMAALAVTAPHAALAAAAFGACAVIVTTAYQLLSTVVDDTIGLYRTSLLSCEGFGVGRHPVAGTQPAQDFSFAYEVVDVDAPRLDAPRAA